VTKYAIISAYQFFGSLRSQL